MRARLLFTVLALTAAPGLALAGGGCSGFEHDQVTMSCPEGQSFDIDTQTCKPPATG